MPAEKQQFAELGYVTRLPIFSRDSVSKIEQRFFTMREALPSGVDLNLVNCWHKANRWVYNLTLTPALLSYVEDILGPDFFLWGAQFFCKFPNDGTIVPWHQDAQYWPLTPRKAVTAWIAIFDTDLANAAMQVVPRSHLQGDFTHRTVDDERYVLKEEIDPNSIRPDAVVTFDLRAGEMSLHDDGLIHGSGPNTSDRIRAGLALRFSPSDVVCDLSVWPTFEAYPVRGDGPFGHNPVGKLPRLNGITTKMFPHSSEFT
jgi:non-heme Fe2+,alpha-ketoglutarate-dependent halogenase